MHIVVGLGNPGEEYENTRHNIGRAAVCFLFKSADFAEDKKNNSLKAEEKFGKEKILLLLPETFMNKSGNAVKGLIKSAKAARNLIVVHDDIDLPLGRLKFSFGRGSAGHKGVESIMRALKTKDFWRIRVGISFATPSGKLKKPRRGRGEKAVLDFLMGKFKPREWEKIKRALKNAGSELERIIQQKIK